MATQTQRRYRPKVVPRDERRGSRVRWDRLGRVILVLVLFGVLASYVGPTLNVLDTWRESKAADRELTALKSENERLQRQVRDLEGPAAAIAEARKLGMVGAGEQAYVIDGLR